MKKQGIFIMKRITLISILICLCLGCTSTPVSDNTNWDGDFGYRINNSGETQTVTITRYRGESKDVIIPDNVNGIPVTSIYEQVFRGKELTSVIIPSSVTYIGVSAFSSNQLTSVTIPDSVTTIERSAFYGNQLTSVTIPKGVANIGAYAFSNNQLTSITIPEGYTVIGNAFSNNQLTSIILPSSATTIVEGAFENNRLTSIIIPNSVTSIGNSAFANNQLTSITIPSSVTTIGKEAFANNQLTSITIPSSVRSIEQNAFKRSSEPYDIFAIYGNRSGTYELRNNQWYYNGTVIPQPAILQLGTFAWLVSIDGKSPESFFNIGLIKFTPASLTGYINETLGRNEYFVWPRNFPARITEFYKGSFYLSPGTHTVEVIYLAPLLRGGISYSTDSIIWEQRYLFEGYTYELTAEPTADGKQILFSIRRQ